MAELREAITRQATQVAGPSASDRRAVAEGVV